MNSTAAQLTRATLDSQLLERAGLRVGCRLLWNGRSSPRRGRNTGPLKSTIIADEINSSSASGSQHFPMYGPARNVSRALVEDQCNAAGLPVDDAADELLLHLGGTRAGAGRRIPAVDGPGGTGMFVVHR